MKDIKQLLILLLSSISLAISAQNVGTNKSLSLGFGVEKTYFQDLNYSPLNYRSTGWSFALDFSKQLNNKDVFFIGADMALSTLQSDASDFFDSDKYQVNVEIGYLKRLFTTSEKKVIYVGGQYHSYLDLVSYDDTDAITYLGLHSLDVVGEIALNLSEKHQLSMGLSIPVFGRLVRPPYTGWDKYTSENEDTPARILFKGRWTSINDFIALNWKAQYTWQFSQRWSAWLRHQFRYYQAGDVHKSIIASNHLKVGVKLNF